jgi:hypothetical protein
MLGDRRLLAGNEPPVNTVPGNQQTMEVDKVFAIRVVNANDAPVAVADSYWVSVSTPQMLDVLANDSDIDSAIDPTSIEIIQLPSHGTATPLPDGTVITRIAMFAAVQPGSLRCSACIASAPPAVYGNSGRGSATRPPCLRPQAPLADLTRLSLGISDGLRATRKPSKTRRPLM